MVEGSPYLTRLTLDAFFDPEKIRKASDAIGSVEEGIALIVGTGAALVWQNPDILIYADMGRTIFNGIEPLNGPGKIWLTVLKKSLKVRDGLKNGPVCMSLNSSKPAGTGLPKRFITILMEE